MITFIAAGLVFGSAGVPPVGSRGVKAHKITGETPALRKPLPKPSFNCVASAEQKLCEKCRRDHPARLHLNSSIQMLLALSTYSYTTWSPRGDMDGYRTYALVFV